MSSARWARRLLVRQLKRVPILHRTTKELWVGAKLLRARLRQAGARDRGPTWLQSTLRFSTPLRASTAEALRDRLRGSGLTVHEGRHTLYLPPQPGLAAVLGPVVEAFPTDCGFKLLKRFAAPQQARYLHHADTAGEAALLGGIHEQARAAAALASLDLGPRMIDVVHLQAGDHDLTAMVVEHVEGRRPTVADHGRMLDALDLLRVRGRMSLANPSRYACGDFEVPDCNGNLLVTPQGELRYVDPQLFLFDHAAVLGDVMDRHREVLHFGDRLRVVKGGERFLYQSLPGGEVGRRDPDDRWRLLEPMLAAHGASPRDRVVLDVCCNAGLMMAGALRRGARWAVGWDLPPVAAAAAELLPLLGAGRSTVVGRALHEDVRLAPDLPAWLPTHDDALCLFLAAWHHVGFPPGVGELPWRFLVYEGREHEDSATSEANVATMEQRWGCRAVATQVIADGLCGPRPLVLLARDRGPR